MHELGIPQCHRACIDDSSEVNVHRPCLSILLVSTVQDLKRPEVMFKALGAKLAVGMPFKDIATSDSILLREVPAADDAEARRALRRLAVRPPPFSRVEGLVCVYWGPGTKQGQVGSHA